MEDTFKASKGAIITANPKAWKSSTCNGGHAFGLVLPRHGYFVLQKHHGCPSNTLDCCPKVWRETLAGSRFLASDEQRYAPIEGKALAVSWGLEQARYFTQGCDNLLVVTDHKPLVKIFGDRTLVENTNLRQFRLKHRTLPWWFDLMHMPRKANDAANTTSRHPSPSGSINSVCFVGPYTRKYF